MAVMQACVGDKDEPEFSLEAGSPLPSFLVTLMNGEVFDTTGLQDAGVKNLLILFFNTDCSDCQRELPEMQRLYDRIQNDEKFSRNTRMICIAREENAAEIKDFWEKHDLTMPVSPQSDRKIYNLFATVGIPRLYLANTATSTITAAWPPSGAPSDVVFSLLRD